MTKDNYYFVKLLFIIVFISIILLLVKKINKKYETFNLTSRCDIDTDTLGRPQAIRLSVENKNNMFNLRWNAIEKLDRFFIIMYKNNEGPFIIDPKISNTDIESKKNFEYLFNNPGVNINYRFAVVGFKDGRLGLLPDENKYINAKLTPSGLEIEYTDNLLTKLYCNPNGTYDEINVENCNKNNAITATELEYKNNGNYEEKPFTNSNYETIKQELSYRPKMIFDF